MIFGRDASAAGSGPGRGPALAEEMDQPTLVWQKADGSTVDIPIPPDEPVTFGRDASNMVVLQSTFVSKRHATVGIEGGQFIVRDLKSANGTRVNGEPAILTPLSPGDVIEVGDQTLTFVERGTPRVKAAPPPSRASAASTASAASHAAGQGAGQAPAAAAGGAGGAAARRGKIAAASSSEGPSPAAKMMRLGGVALVFGIGLFLMLRMMLITDAPPSFDTGPTYTGESSWLPDGASPAPLAKDTPLIRQVLQQAQTAGVKPADALFDEAVNQYNAGRLLDAARLFAATLVHQPGHVPAKARLGEVQGELEAAIARHRAEAERLSNQLRYEDSVVEWERVLLLLEPNDPRVPLAKAGQDAAKQRVRR
jgi:hypothetical protein